ncbi:MAG: hypothetical protein ACP5UD_10335, partial [Conexivisphaera sp.]
RRAMRKVIGKSGYGRRKEDARRKVAKIVAAATTSRSFVILSERMLHMVILKHYCPCSMPPLVGCMSRGHLDVCPPG